MTTEFRYFNTTWVCCPCPQAPCIGFGLDYFAGRRGIGGIEGDFPTAELGDPTQEQTFLDAMAPLACAGYDTQTVRYHGVYVDKPDDPTYSHQDTFTTTYDFTITRTEVDPALMGVLRDEKFIIDEWTASGTATRVVSNPSAGDF